MGEDGKYTVVGVVSYGSGCASTTPGAYARVTNYLSWISSNTQDGDCEEGSTDTSTGGSTCSYTDQYTNCGDYKDYCDYEQVSSVCPKTCKCSDDSTDTATCSYRISMTTVGITRIT